MFAAKDALLTRPSGGYVIPRSLRFRSSASAYLNRTFGTPTNNNKWTYSGWFKRGTLGANVALFGNWETTQGANQVYFNTSNQLVFFQNHSSGTNVLNYVTTQVFRDPAACYHIVISYDNTLATTALNIYVNSSSQITAFGTSSNTATQNGNYSWNKSGLAHYLAVAKNTANADFGYADGYFADVNFIDGQALTSTSFGATNATTGVWAPIKYAGTYGANGFHLDFNSYATTAALGTDTSGNSNTWTVNNVSVTAGVTYDSMIDVPTVGTTGSNYCTLNPVDKLAAATWSNGNLAYSQPTGAGGAKGTFAVSSGKWYWEVTPTVNGHIIAAGPVTVTGALADFTSAQGGYGYYWTNGNKYINGVSSAYGAAYATSDVIGVALDMDALTITFYKNNTSQGAITGVPAGTYAPFVTNGGGLTITGTYNFGQQPFTYTPPTGYSALNTYNLPTPTILKGNTVMDATLYTGTGASLSVTNAAGFQPDFVWMKSRSAATDHALYDSVRGTTKDLVSNSTAAETTQTTGLTAFGSGGFTVGALAKINTNAATYVGWQWKGGGAAVTNTNGTMSAQVSANPTSGCSICSFTTPSGTVNPNTFGHGLGVAPSFVITKAFSIIQNYDTYHVGVGNTARILLNTTGAASAANAQYWNNTTPSSTVVTIGTTAWWGSSTNYIAYCFAPIAGYSAFGSYVANNVADGPFVYLGFRPRFIMFKDITGAADWEILDTARSTFNLATAELKPNTAGAETTGTSVDFLSNGFKLRAGAADPNNLTNTYIYAAFAESPFKNSLAR